MTQLLLTVDAVHPIRGGLELSPRVEGAAADLGRGALEVRLERPDGTTLDARAELVFAHISGPRPPFALVRLPGIAESDVPVGTRVFLSGS